MAENWIEEARRKMEDFFSNATEDEILALKEAHGYDTYIKGPRPATVAFELSGDVDFDFSGGVASGNVYIVFSPGTFPARIARPTAHVETAPTTLVNIHITNGSRKHD